jgi:hypothetical protein
MALLNRVRLLERHGVARCPICGGKGRSVVQKINSPFPEDHDKPIDMSGCPGCGKINLLTIAWVKEDMHGRRLE